MILSGREIQDRMGNDLTIDPFDADRLNPNSYNLTLHDELLIYEEVVLDAAAPNRYRQIPIPSDGLTLQPGTLYLGRTAESTETRSLVPMVTGRSSLGRLGLFVNPAGGLGHAGYRGTWTLEIYCVQPVRIYPSIQVCQIAYFELTGAWDDYCSDKYQNSSDIQPSLLHRELGYDENSAQLELSFDEAIRTAR